MKIACVQMDIVFGKPEKNYQQVLNYLTEAADNGADTIVLPEMWNTGYALTELNMLADNTNRTVEMLKKFAKEKSVNIVGGSVSTEKNNGFYNTMYVVNKKGELVSEYDKAHRFGLMDEHIHLEEGDTLGTFKLDNVVYGGVICYDIRFPEWIRAQALNDAKLIFVSAEWPEPRIDHWRTLLQARAIENQCFIVGVNRIGSDPNNVFGGSTMVIAPWGEIRLDMKKEEGIGYVEIDLQEVEEVRKRIPVFDDRREKLYETFKI
ncbi:Aliphatic amidase amiE [Planococcus halocryophilus Or1]|uniref:Carbon-nitrogen hydrolase n=1 Tax=Planococcus halocryophilus TaxID=1215089 RepID=A0A1C7DS46_9BACL|nr:carbon-nitrogen family hydrolase [Planococcus halocryophilus]ANU14285.1 carbon-nitrogen hydrolase [Planococcus halocryophilus]EMF45986.1 Aliphatic amidase amiE [Planococcus halocryophilus Or1]